MQQTDDILIRNNIMPTLLSRRQRECFARSLSLAQDGDLQEFVAFCEDAAHEISTVRKGLVDAATTIEEIISATIESIDGVLGDNAEEAVLFSSTITNSALTGKHVTLLRRIEAHIDHLATTSARLQACRKEAEDSVLSPDFMTEVTLRFVALREGVRNTPLLSFYRALTQSDPLPTENLFSITKQIEERLAVLDHTFSAFVAESSRIITHVNGKEQPQAVYFNLLRAEQIKLHDQQALVNRIKNEVQYVKIPDVL